MEILNYIAIFIISLFISFMFFLKVFIYQRDQIQGYDLCKEELEAAREHIAKIKENAQNKNIICNECGDYFDAEGGICEVCASTMRNSIIDFKNTVEKYEEMKKRVYDFAKVLRAWKFGTCADEVINEIITGPVIHGKKD